MRPGLVWHPFGASLVAATLAAAWHVLLLEAVYFLCQYALLHLASCLVSQIAISLLRCWGKTVPKGAAPHSDRQWGQPPWCDVQRAGGGMELAVALCFWHC